MCGESEVGFFGQAEAQVVCRWLGFPEGNAHVYRLEHDNWQGDGPIWIRLRSDETCTGDESTLEECKQSDLWVNEAHCAHYEDVAVR